MKYIQDPWDPYPSLLRWWPETLSKAIRLLVCLSCVAISSINACGSKVHRKSEGACSTIKCKRFLLLKKIICMQYYYYGTLLIVRPLCIIIFTVAFTISHGQLSLSSSEYHRFKYIRDITTCIVNIDNVKACKIIEQKTFSCELLIQCIYFFGGLQWPKSLVLIIITIFFASQLKTLSLFNKSSK